MANIEVITKGKYTRPNNGIAVEVDRYVIARENGENFILLKLRNKKDLSLSGVTLTIDQYSKEGKFLGTVQENVAVDVEGGQFVLSKKIKVNPACVDFKVEVNAAQYGNYRYSCSNGNVVLDYDDSAYYDASAETRQMNGNGVLVSGRKFRVPLLTCLLAAVLVVCLAAITWLQLNVFTEEAESFISDGVEYTFSEDENGECDGVIITGYTGKSSTVIISARVGGYDVIAIGEEAFKDNQTIKEVYFYSDVDISYGAFSGCSNLETITCDNILNVSDYAFYNCSSLKSITLSSQTEIVGYYAFSGCSALESITIPDSVISLGFAAFEGCYSLKSLTLPELAKFASYYFGSLNYTNASLPFLLEEVVITNSSSIPAYAFYDCEYVRSVTWKSKTMTIGNYAFSGSGIEQIDFSGVTSIGNYAFSGSNLTEADMEGSSRLTNIGNAAFSGCSALSYVTLPSGISTIKNSLFADCTSLSSIEISEGIVEIKEYAFSGCSALTSLVIPDNVTSISVGAFKNCSRLESLTLPSMNTYLSYYFGGTSYSNASVPSSLKEVVVKSGTSIPDYAFYGCSNLSSVTWQCDAVVVGNYAFYMCSALTTLNTPSAVGFIGSYSFCQSGIEQLDLSAANYIGDYAFAGSCIAEADMADNSLLAYIGEYAFSGCDRLTLASIPSGVNEICIYTFENCTSLNTVTLSEGITAIYSHAFSGCSALEALEVPQSVNTMGNSILYNCSGLESLTLPYIEDYLSYYFGSASYISSNNYVPSSLKEVVITGGASVAAYAFYNCSNIESLTLSPDTESIGLYAFYGCAALASIELPESLTDIGEMAFYSCYALTSLVIPQNVTYIGYSAFYNCTNLESLTLPMLDTFMSYYFGSGSYWNNYVPSSLKEVVITGGSEIPAYAFYNCSSLASVELPESLTEVGDYAFNSCSALTSLVIPQNVTYIGYSAFSNCSSLESLTLPMMDSYLSYYFGNNSYWGYNVPSSLTEVTITGGTSIPDYAFYYCSYIQTINLNEGITSIGSYAFQSCTSLQGFEMPSDIEYIGGWAFADCKNLTSIVLPSSLTSSGTYLFNGCYRLYEIGYFTALNYTYDLVGSVYNSVLNVYTTEDDKMERAESGDYQFACASDGWYLVYAPNSATLSLPESFETNGGVQVTSYKIPGYLFYNNSTLETINIPACVEYIGDYAFQTAYNLKEVNFAEGALLTEIGQYTFANCTSLASIDIPEGVETIWWGAFSGCSMLATVTLPQSLTYIYDWAFENCKILREVYNNSSLVLAKGGTDNGMVARYAIVIHENGDQTATVYATVNGINLMYDGAEWYVIGADSTVNSLVLGELEYYGQTISRYNIAPYAFCENYNITSVTIGSAVTEISAYAFAYCGNITTVDMSESLVTTIGEYAFYNCYNLTSVTFSETTEEIGNYAFACCYDITSIDLPSSLTYIGDCAFNWDTALTMVTLRSNVNIGNYAFGDCTALYEVYNLGGMNIVKGSQDSGYIGYYAKFIYTSEDAERGIVYLDNFIFAYSDEEWWLIKYNADNYNTLELPESFTDNKGNTITSYKIAAEAFYSRSMGYIVVPLSVTYVDGLFMNGAYNTWRIYYKGTEDQWSEIAADVSGTEVYYYVECVHEGYSWMYDEYGNVTIGYSYYCEEVVAATCTSEGYGNYVCANCGEVLGTYVIEKTEHTIDENGVCTVCGAEGVYLTAANLDSNGYVTVENDVTYPYAVEGSTFTSTNHNEYSMAEITFTAESNIGVNITIKTSYYSGDCYMYVSNQWATYYFSSEETCSYYLNLQAGDYITITYYKYEEYSSGYYDDCVYIQQLLIFAEQEDGGSSD